MSGEVIIIPADDNEPLTFRKTDKQPDLQELHRIVGGYIELVPHWQLYNEQPCVAFCNEDGKGMGLPINMRATAAWYITLGRRVDDVLVGNVVLLVNLPDEDEEE